ALLQAAGGSLPVIKKDARGVFIMETTSHAPEAAKAAPAPAAKTAVPTKAPAATPAAKPAAAPAPKPAGSKLGLNPDRKLNRRTTYAGVADTGPVPGETFEQKVARLKAVAAAAKQRAEEGGEPTAPEVASQPDSPVVAAVLETAMAPPVTDGPPVSAAVS